MVSICRFLFHCKRLDESVLSKMAFSIFENSDGKFDKAGVDIHWNSSTREVHQFFRVFCYRRVHVAYEYISNVGIMPYDFQKKIPEPKWVSGKWIWAHQLKYFIISTALANEEPLRWRCSATLQRTVPSTALDKSSDDEKHSCHEIRRTLRSNRSSVVIHALSVALLGTVTWAALQLTRPTTQIIANKKKFIKYAGSLKWQFHT